MNLQKMYNLMEVPKTETSIVNNPNLQPKVTNNQLPITNNESKKQDKKLISAVQDFESFFLYSLLKEMRKTIPKDELFGGGREEEFFTDLLDEEVGKALAARGGIGLSAMLYKEFGGK